MSKISNLKFYRNLLAFLTAITLIPSSLGALAENTNEEITDKTRIEEMADEEEEMTLEEFEVITSDLYSEFWIVYRNDVFSLLDLQSGYYSINHESCENIYDDLKEMGVVRLENGKPLDDSKFKGLFVLPYGLKKEQYGKRDFSKLIYRKSDKDFIAPYTDTLIEFYELLHAKKKIKKETMKTVIELLDKVLNEGSDCMKMYMEVYSASNYSPACTYAKTKFSEKERLKYFKNTISVSVRKGVEIDPNTDNELELMILIIKKLELLAEEVENKLIPEYDEAHTNEHTMDK